MAKHPHIIIMQALTVPGNQQQTLHCCKGRLFVNTDVTAQGLSAFQPEAAAFHAGRIMLERLHYLAKARVNFALKRPLPAVPSHPGLTI